MIKAYLEHEKERNAKGIPALPLDPEQTAEVCRLLEEPPAGKGDFLLGLLKERVSPGVDPAAEVKAAFLARILEGGASSPLITKKDAISILGNMLGGYNIGPLIKALADAELAEDAAAALSSMTFVYDAFDEVFELSKTNAAARKVVESWAEGEWFTSRPGIPETLEFKVYKVEGEINTDDFSPASDAATRPDIPLHALAMGKMLFPDGNETIARFRSEGYKVAFVGDVVGTGSSRKSACNSVMWHIGDDIPGVPNKRRGGIVIGGVIAPIFFNTCQDSGGLPLIADVTGMKTGDVLTLDSTAGEIRDASGKVLSTFEITPNTLADEYRAG
ncbi:MAG: aconitate hydratase B, partial [Deltaproteobacteria bacterium]|nr:aconitate hydratase B [Deltaproteobacteria bacterium]